MSFRSFAQFYDQLLARLMMTCNESLLMMDVQFKTKFPLLLCCALCKGLLSSPESADKCLSWHNWCVFCICICICIGICKHTNTKDIAGQSRARACYQVLNQLISVSHDTQRQQQHALGALTVWFSHPFGSKFFWLEWVNRSYFSSHCSFVGNKHRTTQKLDSRK